MATYRGTTGVDLINGTEGDDIVYDVGVGVDIVNTGAGNDTVHYRAGSGLLDIVPDIIGLGSGDDLLSIDFSGAQQGVGMGLAILDPILGLSGTLGLNGISGLTYSGVERFEIFGGLGADSLRGGDRVDHLVGNAGADTINGNGGDDRIQGGAGADLLEGGDGTDALDYTTSNGGVFVRLANGVGIGGHAQDDRFSGFERVMGSGFADTIVGDALDNVISGGSDGDELNGGAGIDALDYRTSTAGVTVTMTDGTGRGGHAQGDSFTGFEFVLGSNYSDRIIGDAGNNRLTGSGGSDVLSGGDGIDTLDGGNGNDILRGGGLRDSMSGGAGADLFSYVALSDSGTTSKTRDTIADFVHAQDDRIDLSQIDARSTKAGNQGFAFVGSDGFSGASGELRSVVSGENTLVEADVNGDRIADFSILMNGAMTLTAADFIL